jgi:hypothetical protein
LSWIDAPKTSFRASTGPRHGGRGNLAAQSPAPALTPCFNGAAPRGARKLRACNSSSRFFRCASTGPRHGGRGNGISDWRDVKIHFGFNGAAPRGARKWLSAQRRHDAQSASTGPRHGGRGNVMSPWFALVTPLCFNGAAPRGARKYAVPSAMTKDERRFNGAAPRGARKCAGIRGHGSAAGQASTGPRHGGRGNQNSDGTLSPLTSLQRGRATGGAEIPRGN